MIYSCFDSHAGLYDYFEDSQQISINADLPVPRLPAATGQIGVPSITAGRPLPSGARHVGKGWHARGIVVDCGKSGSLGLYALPSSLRTALYVSHLAASGALVYHGYKRNHGSVGWGLVWGLLGGIVWPITLPIALGQGFGKLKR